MSLTRVTLLSSLCSHQWLYGRSLVPMTKQKNLGSGYQIQVIGEYTILQPYMMALRQQ